MKVKKKVWNRATHFNVSIRFMLIFNHAIEKRIWIKTFLKFKSGWWSSLSWRKKVGYFSFLKYECGYILKVGSHTCGNMFWHWRWYLSASCFLINLDCSAKDKFWILQSWMHRNSWPNLSESISHLKVLSSQILTKH